MLAGMAALCTAGRASAEVLIRLESGSEIPAARAWKDGDVVRVAFLKGVATFPVAAIVAVDEHPPSRSAPLPQFAQREERPETVADEPDDGDAPAAPRAAAPPPLTVDERVPDIKGEDSRSKLERLDALSMQTHRQLSIARTQGQPKETLEALQRKLDTINGKRKETMKRLGE
jgi:type IV secretory pathway VirB10-like protein